MRTLTALAAGLWIVLAVQPAPTQEKSAQPAFLHGARFKPLTYPIDPVAFNSNLSKDERDIYALIEKLVVVRLKDTLDIDDAAMTDLYKHNGVSSKQLTMLKWQRAGLREQLRWCLEFGQSEQRVKENLDLLLNYEENIAEELKKMVYESRPVLGVAKSAELYLFVDDFERFLATRVDEAMKKGHAGEDKPAGESSAETKQPVSGEADFKEFLSMLRQQNEDVRLSEAAGEDVIKLVDALLVVRLSQALDLNKEQTVKLFAHVGKVKDQLHELKWQIGHNRSMLRQAIANGASDEQIQKQLDDLLIEEKAVADLVREFVEGAGKDITVAQSAKLYLFLGDFEAYIVDLLERAEG